ncbi:hypothetical protein D3C80_1245290 [compost metagenome]
MLFYVLLCLLQRIIRIPGTLTAAYPDTVEQLLKSNLCPEADLVQLHFLLLRQLTAYCQYKWHRDLCQQAGLRKQLCILEKTAFLVSCTVLINVKVKHIHLQAP